MTTTLAGRFRIDGVIRDRGSRRTLHGHDLFTESPVVIKTIDREGLSPMSEALVQHEAAVLSRLDARLVPSLIDVGREADVLYLAMPRLPGRTLAEHLDQVGRLSARVGIAVGQRVAETLAAAHEAGLTHRDVKPSNVMVDGLDGHAPTCHLIDFGLSSGSQLAVSPRDLDVRTLRHLSPEAAGSIDVAPDERSDLYSLGVLLFEAITGEPPFDAPSPSELLRQHLSSPVPSLRDRGATAPRSLDEVVQRLLAKDPDERYQSAGAVADDLARIASQLDEGVAEPTVVVGQHERRRSLALPVFVGREQELGQLRAQLTKAGSERSQLVLLESVSGGGKTRVLSEFAKAAAQAGAWVLRGQGLDQAAPRPFQLLRGVAEGLIEACSRDDHLARRLAEVVGDDAQAIVDALPMLSEVFGVAADGLGSADHGEQRSIRALRVLLDALGDLWHPTVVLLDDCQWGDEQTVKALQAWSDRGDGRSSGLLVVAAYRSEEVDQQHPLRAIAPDLHVPLAGLGRRALLALLESMAGSVPTEASAAILERCEGSPFMAVAMLRGMVEDGVMHQRNGRWVVEPELLHQVHGSLRSAAFLCRRIHLLEVGSQELLRVGAVLGKQFSLALAAQLLQLDLPDVLARLEQPRQRHIIWFDPASGTVSFTHDKLRESILVDMDPAARRELHRRAAERIERLDAGRFFELAYHFDAAGLHERALPYALEAAASSRDQHSLQVATEQYRIARRGAEGADRQTLGRIAEGLGNVAMLRGAYDEAERELTTALELASDPIELAELRGRLGELAFKRGDSEQAAELTRQGLHTLGRRVPSTTLGHIAITVFQVLVQAVHTLLPRWTVARRRLDDPRARADLLAARLLSRLAHACWFAGGTFPTAAAHLRGMNIAERYPPTPEVAQAYSEHAPVMTLITWFSRGIEYAERSLQIRRDLGDIWGQGQSLHFYGVVLYGASRYRECIARCREAIRLLERTGDQWEVNTARWHVAYSHYRMGELEQAAEVAREVHDAGVRIGDGQARGISLAAWSKATGGDVPPELLVDELALIDTDVHTGAEVLQAEAVRLLRSGRPEQAADVLRRARGMVLRAVAMQEYVAPLFAWLATATRQHAEQASVFGRRQLGRRLRRARRAAFVAVLVSRAYRNNLPHALREAGLVLALLGRGAAARRRFERSAAAARSQGARAELLTTLRAGVRVGQELGWDVRSWQDEAARLAVRLGEGPGRRDLAATHATASLVDRFEQVLEAGRRIATSLSRDAAHQAVRDAALSVLRGDECVIVDVSGAAPVLVHGGDGGTFSADAVARAVAAGHCVLFDELSSPSSAHEVIDGVRSGLSIPIVVGDRAQCVLQVSSRQLAGLYGAQELQLAEFIAALAGAALENVRGFDRVADHSARLEREVAARTAELEGSVAAERLARRESERRAGLMARLASAGRAMSSLDPAAVLASVMAVVRDLGFEGAEICVLEEDGQTYRVADSFGLPDAYVARPHPADVGVVGQVLRDGTTVVVEDYRDVPDAYAEIVEDGFQTSIAVPILSKGERVGAIVGGNRSRRRVPQDEVDAFELLASQVGRALENARAYEEQLTTIERLAEVDRLKDDFLTCASHELRTPLAIINGMAETLDDHWDRLHDHEIAATFLKRIRSNATALAGIINDLLDFSRLQQGTVVLECAPLDLSAAATQLADRLDPLFADHDLHLDLDQGVQVLADPMMLGRALENLLSNAVRYTPAGTRVRLEVKRRSAGEVEVAVQDDGPGIAPGDLERITERFYRGEGATLSSRRGLGLGLAFTSDILTGHRSRLEVSNVPDSGARFAFRLPLAASLLRAPATTSP